MTSGDTRELRKNGAAAVVWFKRDLRVRDQDPQGLYIRQWVPEIGTAAYPPPIVDERIAVAAAKDRLYGLRRTREAQAEADAIQHKHGSRKSGLPPTGTRARRTRARSEGQGELFQSSFLRPSMAKLRGALVRTRCFKPRDTLGATVETQGSGASTPLP